MFGPIMRFVVGTLTIELAPLTRDDMPRFITNGGMQNFEVTRYLGRSAVPVLEDEYEWFDHIRGDATTFCWGIYVVEGTTRTLIGNTSLNSITREVMAHGTSGFLIFDQDYWNKKIASHCHRARTWYGCAQMGLVQIRSAAYERNVGSCKALLSVGYVPICTERNFGFVDGSYLSMTSFGLINPIESLWQQWWHGDPIPEEYQQARVRSLQALEWAQQHISFG